MYSGDCAGLPLSAFYTAKLWEVFEKMKKSYEMDMCTGPLLKKLLIFAVPLILSGVLQLLFNAADIVVVGKFAGSHALAAVGSTGALINLFTNVFIGFSIGANVLVAQYFGAKDEQNIQDTVHTSMAIGIIGGMFLIGRYDFCTDDAGSDGNTGGSAGTGCIIYPDIFYRYAGDADL